MKTKEEQITKITYLCDKCDFQSDSEWQVDRHNAIEHLLKKKIEINNKTFYFADSEENAKNWLAYMVVNFTFIRDLVWTGPGWYIFDQSEDWYFVCSNRAVFRPAKNWIDQEREKANQILDNMNHISYTLEVEEAELKGKGKL